MNLSDSIELQEVISDFDENLNEIEVKEWILLGKCHIMPNTSARLTKTNDGKGYVYAYEILMHKPKKQVFPKENDLVRIKKKDGTIDKECRVIGFVTMRYWLKLWV